MCSRRQCIGHGSIRVSSITLLPLRPEDETLTCCLSYTRSPRTTPEARKDDSYCVPGTGDPDGLIPAKWFHGTSADDINTFLDQDLDILVLSLPLTSETHGIISHEQFQILSKKKTYVLYSRIT